MEGMIGRHLITLFLILLFSIWLLSQRSTRDRDLRYFWLTVISCIFLVIEDVGETWASMNPDLRILRTFFSAAGYVLRSTASVGLLMVVSKRVRKDRYMWIPFLLNLVLCASAFFTDLVFGFDEEYRFYRGPLGFVPFAVPLFYLAVILWLTFKRYGEGSRKIDRLIFVLCVTMCLSSVAMDSTHGGTRLHEAIMISVASFYFFLRSYDVRKDSLTQLLNRQSLYDDCEIWKKSICAAASLDMNGLKEMNDTWGHHAGDAALQKIGACMLESTGPHTRAYRIGGDEFVILFLRSGEEEIRSVLETIRAKTEEAGYSIACGYAMREAQEEPDSLIRRSDMEMFTQKARYYREKNHDRRNRGRRNTDRVSDEGGRALEESPQPAAVYRFENHNAEAMAVSDGFCRLFGYPDKAQAVHILDQDLYRGVHPDDQERYAGAMLRFSEGKEELDVVYRIRSGEQAGYRVIHARGKHVHTGTEARIGYVWYMDEGDYLEEEGENGSHITLALSRILREESILHSTHFDSLTGLPNLAWFFELFEAGKARMRGEGKQPAILYMDLNGMKYFNHRNGFTEGDRLLKAFAEALVRIFGKENCCHVSADHFAAFTTGEDAESQVRRLFQEAERINDGKGLPVMAGIYTDSMETLSASSGYDRAKMACDAIRRSDYSILNYFNDEIRDRIRREQYIVQNIDQAVAEKWIHVYYQPIVSAADERICDEEALARWVDRTEGFLAPDDFIPQLEKAGLAYRVDLYVLDQVLDKIRRKKVAGEEVPRQSINLSRSDFEVCDIVEEIRKRVDAAGVERSALSIEITEGVLGRDFQFMKEQIAHFRELGFSVWMDDFGSGYSSLNVLQNIAFDAIKFDMSFLRMMDRGEKGEIILTDLIRMINELHIDTVCEGVETENQVRFLQETGCRKLQGFYFGKPAPETAQPPRTETAGENGGDHVPSV